MSNIPPQLGKTRPNEHAFIKHIRDNMNSALLSLQEYDGLVSMPHNQEHYENMAIYQRLIAMHDILLQQQTTSMAPVTAKLVTDQSTPSISDTIQQLHTQIKIMNDNNKLNEEKQNQIINLLKKNNELLQKLSE